MTAALHLLRLIEAAANLMAVLADLVHQISDSWE